ncbi:MAG: chorismate mutase, partial [Firmicutes bacterium]|nr:chorismate mutase [Bacillota bacterium]
MGCVVRGIRGATSVSQNNATEIKQATRELLHKMAEDNGVKSEDCASIIFS